MLDDYGLDEADGDACQWAHSGFEVDERELYIAHLLGIIYQSIDFGAWKSKYAGDPEPTIKMVEDYLRSQGWFKASDEG